MDVTRLRRLLREVDEEHRDTMRTVTDELTAAAHAASRRAFVRGSLLAGGAAALVAGPLAGAAAAADATTTTAAPKQPQAGDLTLLAFAQSVELAAAGVYGAALATGKLTSDVAAVATTFQRHHTEHAQAIGGLAGKAATGVANAKLLKEYGDKVAAANGQNGVLEVAFALENAAAATYAYALTLIVGTNASAAAASIQPVEARHAVVIGQVLGKSLTELAPAFEPADLRSAIDPTKYPVQG